MGDLAAGHSYGGKSLRRPSDRSPGANIARTYRQAAQLYLTRRLPEALSTLKPIISPRLGSGKHRDDADGADAKEADAAAIASSSRASRVKVWSFYLTLLHSVVELGPEEGKEAFGSAPWRAVVGKVRDGSVWEDVVRLGYAGDEASVDGEVVINLATLLLAHSPSQIRNQERMENYISATSAAVTSFSSQADLPVTSPNHSSDLRPHTPDNVPTVAGTEEQNGRHDDTGSLSSGRTITNSNPRALATRLRLLELYVLHILPHNEEWELAHHFIQSSADLDDDKREAFLQALQALAEQQRQTHMRQEELGRQKQMQQQQSVRPSRIEPPSNRPVTENTPYSASASSTRPPPPLADSAGRLGAAKGKRERQQQKQGGDARSERRQTQSPQPPSRLHKNGGAQDKISGVDATAAASPTPSHKPTPLQLAMAIMARSLKTYAHPSTAMRLLRSLLFTLILITLLARRDIRQTLRSLLNGARLKVGQTVKMAIIAN